MIMLKFQLTFKKAILKFHPNKNIYFVFLYFCISIVYVLKGSKFVVVKQELLLLIVQELSQPNKDNF